MGRGLHEFVARARWFRLGLPRRKRGAPKIPQSDPTGASPSPAGNAGHSRSRPPGCAGSPEAIDPPCCGWARCRCKPPREPPTPEKRHGGNGVGGPTTTPGSARFVRRAVWSLRAWNAKPCSRGYESFGLASPHDDRSGHPRDWEGRTGHSRSRAWAGETEPSRSKVCAQC